MDRKKLSKMLKFGCLTSSPVLRHFAQENEDKGILAICKSLLKVCSSPGFEGRKAIYCDPKRAGEILGPEDIHKFHPNSMSCIQTKGVPRTVVSLYGILVCMSSE